MRAIWGVVTCVITAIFVAPSQATVVVLTSNPAAPVVPGTNGGVIVNIPGSIVNSDRTYTVTGDADDYIEAINVGTSSVPNSGELTLIVRACSSGCAPGGLGVGNLDAINYFNDTERSTDEFVIDSININGDLGTVNGGWHSRA